MADLDDSSKSQHGLSDGALKIDRESHLGPLGNRSMLGAMSKSSKSAGRRRSRLAGLMVGIASLGIVFALTAANAMAVEPPQFREIEQEVIKSTRAVVEVLVETHGVEGHWTSGYSTHEDPTEFGEEWIGAGEGTIPSGGSTNHISVGEPDATSRAGEGRCRVLHHLSPQTQYYVHFTLTTAGGKSEATFRLTKQTNAIEKPEIPSFCLNLGGSTLQPAHGTRTTQAFTAQIETNGAPTEYHFEYSTSEGGPWQPFTSKSTGTVSVTEDFADPEAELTGLTPETKYFVRLKASHTGTTEEAVAPKSSFTTPTAKPIAEPSHSRNVRATSAVLFAQLDPSGSQTHWRFESASSAIGPWTPVPGLEGVISQSEAEALPESNDLFVEGSFGGLIPSTKYCVRLFAENAAGEGENGFGEPISAADREVSCFETAAPPSPETSAVHAIDPGSDPGSLRLLGSINPGSTPTSEEQAIALSGAPGGGSFTLEFEGQSTAKIAYNASAEDVRKALEALPSNPQIAVYGRAGGPYTVVFAGSEAEVDEPQITGDGSSLVPAEAVQVETIQEGGEGYGLKYYFEYVTEQQFDEGEFAGGEKTPEITLSPGGSLQLIGQDVAGMQAGQAYRYRIVVSSSFPGTPIVRGASQSITVPAPTSGGEQAACPNAQMRVGPSANLPDCRAYEQVSPIDKEGAQEPFNYGPTAVSGGVVGEDGEHLALEDPAVNWGTDPESGQSPYFFSRSEALARWTMLSGAPQPQTGVQRVVPELFSGDLGQVALEADVHTSLGSGESKEIEFEVGPSGGPYTIVASVPRDQAPGGSAFYEGWVASSDDFSKLILQLEDHSLVTPRTKTKEGNDLYEYSGGGLKQVNVGIGTCGAHIASGQEMAGVRSSSHALSSDGSSVFFEAAPASNCAAPTHLYIRKNASETIDLGEYRFAGADPTGDKALLEKENNGVAEYFLYDGQSKTTTKIFSGATQGPREATIVSQDFSTIYFHPDSGDLYRYDVDSGSLTYLFREEGEKGRTSPNGRFYYFQGAVGGVPGRNQVFMYDSSENVVQCISCTSSDPDPKLGAVFPHHALGDLGPLQPLDGHPSETFFSEDGNYAFFDTPSALVANDVDGEVAPDDQAGAEDQSEEFSPSSDVYEWRRNGVDGCDQIEGCVALITNGRGGFLNLVIGTTPSGHDVFIYSSSQLVSQDDDKAGDIYDVRIDGGFPPPAPPPVECEGDACSTPASAPNDATPASSIFAGLGNVPALQSKAKPKAITKPKRKVKRKTKKSKKKRKVGSSRKRSKAGAKSQHVKGAKKSSGGLK